jgi:hypothetical protein
MNEVDSPLRSNFPGGQCRRASHRAFRERPMFLVVRHVVRAMLHRIASHRAMMNCARDGWRHAEWHEQHSEQNQYPAERMHDGQLLPFPTWAQAHRAGCMPELAKNHDRIAHPRRETEGAPTALAIAVLAGARVAVAARAALTSAILLRLWVLPIRHLATPFFRCSKRANLHIASVPWYRVKPFNH